MKAVLRRMPIALSAQVKKLERSYTNNLIAYLRSLEQKEANSPRKRRRQEILKLRAKINHTIGHKTTLNRYKRLK